jgi:hypothetical protein
MNGTTWFDEKWYDFNFKGAGRGNPPPNCPKIPLL